MPITTAPTLPSRTMSQDAFDAAMANLMTYIPVMVSDISGVQAAILEDQATASSAATTATAQAVIAAEQAALAATSGAEQVALAAAQVVLTHDDATDTAADRVQTGLDRAQTGLDRTAAASSVAAAALEADASAASAAAAEESAIAAAASAASIAGGPVASVTATAPVSSTGGATPVISMAPATVSVDGYMTAAQATKLAGIAAGATANTGDVTLAGVQTLTNKTLTAPAIGTPVSGNLSNTTADGTNAVGFRHIPQLDKTSAYTLVIDDAGKHIHKGGTTAFTATIPSNASVAFPIGTAITFVNSGTSGAMTIAITTDTMRLAGAGTTGSRALAAYGVATAVKVTSTLWMISGSGLT